MAGRYFKRNRITRVPRKERADVLLVYPVWVQLRGRGSLQRMLPPLGVLSIAANLERHGFEVHIVDLHAEQLGPEQFRAIVRRLLPRYVGITVLTTHFVPANHAAKICKEEVADVQVFVGGTHAEANPEEMLRNPFIDGVGRGDGEELMVEVAEGRPYDQIAGLSHRVGGLVVHNEPRPVVMDLDAYPLPAYHLIDLENYFPPVGSYKDLPAMNVLFTRGCPGKCTFCNSANTPLRRRSVGKIVELIKMLRYDYGIRHVSFYDDTFTANPKIVDEFCQKMIDERVDVKWTCFARGDMFRERIAERMAKAGCRQVLIGIESGSERLMARVGKRIEKDKYREVVRVAKKYGIETRGSFIIGNPGETLETMQETVDFAKELGVDFFQLNIMTPYPGTQLYREAKAKGLLLHEDYSRYGQSEVVLALDDLTPDDVARFDQRAYYQFYLRPAAMWAQLRRISSVAQASDLLKAAFVVLFERLQKASGRADHLQRWLDIDLDALFRGAPYAPVEPKLTWEVSPPPKAVRRGAADAFDAVGRGTAQ